MTDGENELQFLLKKNAELNSPEAQAAKMELSIYLEQQKQMTAEPLEAKRYIPFTDTAEFNQRLSQVEQNLQEMRNAQETSWQAQLAFEEAERQARIEAEKRAERTNQKQIEENRIWQTVIVILGVLTLVATILGLLK